MTSAKKGARCIVTGGAGFIGSHIADLLIAEGMDVVVIDNLSTGVIENLNPKAEFIKADLVNLESVSRHFEGAQYVFHVAALPRIQPSFELPLEHENANVIATINCLLACKGRSVKKLVYSSSSSCYGNPTEFPTSETAAINCLNPYALQKYAAEQYCFLLGRWYGIPTVALRYFNAYGPRSFNPKNPLNAYSSVIGIFTDQHKRGVPLNITGDGGQSRDFVHVYDMARANLMAALSDKVYEPYNVGCGSHYTIKHIASVFGGEHQYIPERQGEARITWANIEKIKRELGWVPKIGIDEGINLV